MARRLAAILAADVVGYSRLMAADEAGTHARLKALRKEFIEPKIAEHHGRVVKLMGDGALVEFASVVDAVQCAVGDPDAGVAERKAELPEDRRIAFRIGINLGDMIIEDDDIYGDGVNVAARLEALAEPGDICVSRTVYDQVEDKVALRLRADSASSGSRTSREPVHVLSGAYRTARRRRQGARQKHEPSARRGIWRCCGCGGRAPGRRWRRRAVAALGRARDAASTAAGRDADDDLRGPRRH